MPLQDHGEVPGAEEGGRQAHSSARNLQQAPLQHPPPAAGHRHGGGQSAFRHPNSALRPPAPLSEPAMRSQYTSKPFAYGHTTLITPDHGYHTEPLVSQCECAREELRNCLEGILENLL
ncbi:hypothetical protein NQZ68_024309 [Dissostichus eleginoides]|nr:hypothetical protein NQZ68_024309 [Dissostichus eleginoides]